MASQPVPKAGFNLEDVFGFGVCPAGGRGWWWSLEDLATK